MTQFQSSLDIPDDDQIFRFHKGYKHILKTGDICTAFILAAFDQANRPMAIKQVQSAMMGT